MRYRPSLERYDYYYLAIEEFRLIERFRGKETDRLIGRYRHLAFEEFRLIELLPAQETDRLIGRLITVDVTSAPQYVALSYV